MTAPMLLSGLSRDRRVVKRTSPAWGELVKGWAERAITPAASSKPTSAAMSWARAIWPSSDHSRGGSSAASSREAAATSGVSRSRRSAKTGSSSATRAPGSNSSSRAS